MKFPNKDFFSKCDQIHKKQQIWSDLLKKSLMENLIFCAVYTSWKHQNTSGSIERDQLYKIG